jgi:anti-sigma B factor antagonist
VDALAVTTQQLPRALVLAVTGELDLYTAPQLHAALEAGVDAAGPGCPDVVVDLGGVGFVDSTGLGEIVAAHKALAAKHARLHLVVSHDRVLRLLRLTGLDGVLDVHPDLPAALGSLPRS